MAELLQCSRCGGDIDEDVPFRQCPRCLLELGRLPASLEQDEQPLSHQTPSLPDFELLVELGRGGTGIIYRARQRSLDRLVAVKLIGAGAFASPASLARFRREAEAAAKLDHPNIVPIYEIGEHEATPYLVMRLVEGTNLAETHPDFFASHPAGRERRVAQLISLVARAAHFAHSRGVLHRDLKPSNILIDAAGNPHLTDFGLAKFVGPDAALTQTAEVLGTPFYMSPEQAGGKLLGVGSDIFSLGVILYELLTGQRPFQGERPVDILRQVIEADPIPPRTLNRSIDRDMATICLKSLDKDPARRYPTALALAEDLERWKRREPIQARRAGAILRVQRWTVRNPALATLIVGLSVGMAVSLSLLATAREEKSRKSTALAILRTETARQLQEIWESPSPFFSIKSETLSALAGNEPGQLRPGERRLTIGLLADGNPVDRVLGVAPALERLETSISTLAHESTRIDLRLYKSNSRAIADLLAGQFELIPINARDYVRAKSEAPAIQLLARVVLSPAAAGPENSVIFALASSGIKQMDDLRGKSLLFGAAGSMATFWAKTALVEAGIHASDLSAIRYVDEPEEPLSGALPDRRRPPADLGNPYSEMTPVEAVLQGTFDAAIASERRFKQVSKGEKLFLIRRLPISRLVIVARSGVPALGAIQKALIGLKEPEILQSFPGSPAGFEPCSDHEFAELRKQLEAESLFNEQTVARKNPNQLRP